MHEAPGSITTSFKRSLVIFSGLSCPCAGVASFLWTSGTERTALSSAFEDRAIKSNNVTINISSNFVENLFMAIKIIIQHACYYYSIAKLKSLRFGRSRRRTANDHAKKKAGIYSPPFIRIRMLHLHYFTWQARQIADPARSTLRRGVPPTASIGAS